MSSKSSGWLLALAGALLVAGLAWVAWRGGPQDCAKVPEARIGHSMVLAGCDRR
jgi:hypothetical protein